MHDPTGANHRLAESDQRALALLIRGFERRVRPSHPPVRYECFVAGEASALLSEVPLFADLEPAELDLVAIAMDEVTFAPGTAVTVEGQPADGFFVVASGEADVTVQGERVATIKSGDYFGEIALLMGGERTATITATTELRCYGISPTDFRPLVEGNPTIAWKLMGSMTRHLS